MDESIEKVATTNQFSNQSLEYVERKWAPTQSAKSTTAKKTFPNIVPGDLTFAEVTAAENYAISPNKNMSVRKLQEKPPVQEPINNRKRQVVTVLGDSTIRGIKKKEINRNAHKYNSFVKTFPGATVDDMESYIIPTLNRKPDVLIFHFGTNDMWKEDPKLPQV